MVSMACVEDKLNCHRAPSIGEYTFIVRDIDGNITTESGNIENILDIPRNLSSAKDSIIEKTNPVFSWNEVDGVMLYS